MKIERVVVVVIRTSSKYCKDGRFSLLVEVKGKEMCIDFKTCMQCYCSTSYLFCLATFSLPPSLEIKVAQNSFPHL